MSDIESAKRIKELAGEYYAQQISLSEYREARKDLLDSIDVEINGVRTESLEKEDEKSNSSILDKAFSIFKS